MKLFGAAAVLVVAVSALASGASPTIAALRAECRPASLVFYTTDSVRLATELAAKPSACASYYVSVGPTSTGAPRGGAALTAIHALGSRVHALAELRLTAWAGYAATSGWYAAGVEARREMRAAGYDAAAGDTWAVNEVGGPSGTPMALAVLENTGTARTDLRDFVRGLYTSDDGVASAGVVFAADPLHVSPDVSQYREALGSWYQDAPFWTDMHRFVRFWAQETYADMRAWGVAAASTSERGAYLDDYFLHGMRLAAEGGIRTEAARAFFADAYTPIGNASYRWGPPDLGTGIGFGATDADLPTMLGFVAGQTAALRASAPTHFGFAFVPRNAVAAETLAVADQLAAAIQASDTDPAGACGSGGDCAANVAGAAFNAAWQSFANTREGRNVVVRIGAQVKVTFAQVTARGATQATTATSPPPPRGLRRVAGSAPVVVATTAGHDGGVEVCLGYPATQPATTVRLFQLQGRLWRDVTTNTSRRFSCGRSPTLGTFAAFTAKRA
jgi:hypothetical protein